MLCIENRNCPRQCTDIIDDQLTKQDLLADDCLIQPHPFIQQTDGSTQDRRFNLPEALLLDCAKAFSSMAIMADQPVASLPKITNRNATA
jgi:hypothetical protein